MKLLIFDHTNSEKRLNRAMERVASFSSVPLFWEIRKEQDRIPLFDAQSFNGHHHVNKEWFKNVYTTRAQGFDFCVAYFSVKQWKKGLFKNLSMAESIEQNFGVSEIAMCGSLIRRSKRPLAPKTRESEFVVRLLHEMCHGMFDHKLHTEDITHYWHYDKGNLLEAIKLWQQQSNREKLYQTAFGCIGTDASPNDVAPDELGCAETVNAIHKKTFGHEIGGSVSTYLLYQALRSSTEFIKVDAPLRGDIVISPTGYGSGGLSNGHVGIVADSGMIMSNDSRTGLFSLNYTLDSWRNRYVKLGGYPMDFYRRI